MSDLYGVMRLHELTRHQYTYMMKHAMADELKSLEKALVAIEFLLLPKAISEFQVSNICAFHLSSAIRSLDLERPTL